MSMLVETPAGKKLFAFDEVTYVCVSGGKICLFFGNLGVLCFLETPVLRFALLPYYRRYYHEQLNKSDFLKSTFKVFLS